MCVLTNSQTKKKPLACKFSGYNPEEPFGQEYGIQIENCPNRLMKDHLISQKN